MDDLKIEEIPAEHRHRYLNRAIQEIGTSLAALGDVLQQGARPDNQAKLGIIAGNLERAALYVSGKRTAS